MDSFTWGQSYGGLENYAFFSTEFSRKYFWDYHQYLTLSLQIFQHPSIPSLQVTYDLPSLQVF